MVWRRRWGPGPHALSRRDLEKRGKDATADGSEVGNPGWIPAAPSLTAHFPLPPPRCSRRVPPVRVEGLQGLSCHPGGPPGPRLRPPPPPTASTPSSGRWSLSSAWVRPSRARRAGPSYRLKGSGPRTPGPEPQHWRIWRPSGEACGWRQDGAYTKTPESPKGKDPTQRDEGAVRTWACGECRGRPGRCAELWAHRTARVGFVQIAAEITQGCENCPGSERERCP